MKSESKAYIKDQTNIKDQTKAGFAELFVEIGCEEIPAGMLPKAEVELRHVTVANREVIVGQ